MPKRLFLKPRAEPVSLFCCRAYKARLVVCPSLDVELDNCLQNLRFSKNWFFFFLKKQKLIFYTWEKEFDYRKEKSDLSLMGDRTGQHRLSLWMPEPQPLTAGPHRFLIITRKKILPLIQRKEEENKQGEKETIRTSYCFDGKSPAGDFRFFNRPAGPSCTHARRPPILPDPDLIREMGRHILVSTARG